MKRVVIIGGGIAGMSAGIFAQLNGFDSVIVEKHTVMGGQCTGWDRGNYHIDGCLHWLIGTKEGTPLNKLWQTVGVLGEVPVYQLDSFLSCEYDGTQVHLYGDLGQLRASWLHISPGDKSAIDQFCHAIKGLEQVETPMVKPLDLMSLKEKYQYLKSMQGAWRLVQKYSKVSLNQLAATFSHPALQQTLQSFYPLGYNALSALYPLSCFSKGQVGIPQGGSRALAQRMAKRYLALGGRIVAGSAVVRLEIQGKTVRQAIGSNGDKFAGDYFIAALDAHHFFTDLLRGRYPDKAFQLRFNNPRDYPLASDVYIALGFAGSMDDVPRTLRFPITPFTINGKPVDHLTITHYGLDPSFAPPGHSLITVDIHQPHGEFEAWDELADEREAYRQEKQRIGEQVRAAIIRRFPYMEGRLELLDILTPKTYERFCNAYRGAYLPFLPTVRGKMMAHSGEIQGLDNIFLSGQWLQPPGGLPAALVTGKDTIMRLCRREKREFVMA